MEDTKMKTDVLDIIKTIYTNENKLGILSMFKKGPPKDKGFMWCNNDDIYWTEYESKGLEFVKDLVLQKGWDSSGYGIMMRNIQNDINNLIRN